MKHFQHLVLALILCVPFVASGQDEPEKPAVRLPRARPGKIQRGRIPNPKAKPYSKGKPAKIGGAKPSVIPRKPTRNSGRPSAKSNNPRTSVSDQGQDPKKKFDAPEETKGIGPPEDDKDALKDLAEKSEQFLAGFECTKKYNKKSRIRLNMPEMDIQDALKTMAAITCQNFILGSIKGKAKISIMSYTPVTVAEAWRAFLIALDGNKLTMIKAGKFWKVIDAKSAAKDETAVYSGKKRLPNETRVVTVILPLKTASIQDIKPVIDKMLSGSGNVLAYPATNSLIVTDTATNITRLKKIIGLLDVGSNSERIWTYEVRHATASEIVEKVQTVFEVADKKGKDKGRSSKRKKNYRDKDKSSSSPAGGLSSDEDIDSVRVSKILADDRTNLVIVISNKKSFEKILQLVYILDVPIQGEGSIRVVPIKHSKAEEIAQTINDLYQGTSGKKNRRNKDRAKSKAKSTSGSGATFTGDMKITADEPSNSLVVVSSRQDFIALKQVLEMLDRPRKQVYVEAVIMEVTLNGSHNSGFKWSGGYKFETEVDGEQKAVPLFGGYQALNSSLTAAATDSTALNGLAVGLQGPEIPGLEGLTLPAFSVLLTLLQTNDDVNVLSTPQLLTMDNEEATISIGRKVPFLNGVSGGGLGALAAAAGASGGTGGANLAGLGSLGGVANVQREDISLELTIKPQINQDGYVTLEIKLKDEDLGPASVIAGQPTTIKREAKTMVVARDQIPIVIGGLMRDKETQSVGKVPLLGDIPVIGFFFRESSRDTLKENLMVVLTPYIISSPEDLKSIYKKKMEDRRKFIELYSRLDSEYDPYVDYSRKHGPVEEMHQAVESELRRRKEKEDTAKADEKNERLSIEAYLEQQSQISNQKPEDDPALLFDKTEGGEEDKKTQEKAKEN